MRIFRIADAIERGKQERDTVESAVTLMRRLTAVLPRLDPSLAGMLRLLARSLSEEGHQEQALAAVEESVRICRHGIDTRRSRHDVQPVWSLRAQADILESLGRGEEAVAARDSAGGAGSLPPSWERRSASGRRRTASSSTSSRRSRRRSRS